MRCSKGVLGQDERPRSSLCCRVSLASSLAEKHHGRERSQAFSRVDSCLRSHRWVFIFLGHPPHCPTQLCCGHYTCEHPINESEKVLVTRAALCLPMFPPKATVHNSDRVCSAMATTTKDCTDRKCISALPAADDFTSEHFLLNYPNQYLQRRAQEAIS